MLSRVADTIYWMQRYRERAENVARLMEVNLHMSVDLPGSDTAGWDPVVKTTGDEADFSKRYDKATEKNVIQFLTFDLENPNSILSCLQTARVNARAVREVLPSEMWQELNTAYLYVAKAAQDRRLIRSAHIFYNRIIRQCQLFTGIADTTLSHNEAWHFGRVGYLLERADMTSRILDVKYFLLLPSAEHVGTPYDDIQWSALLKSASALEMYRKKWHQILPAAVVDFLILNRDFPRAIHSCLARAKQSLKALEEYSQGAFNNLPADLVTRFCNELHELNGEQIVVKGLHEFLNDIQLRLIEIHDSMHLTFFALRPVGRSEREFKNTGKVKERKNVLLLRGKD